jgi:hypothetical protein
MLRVITYIDGFNLYYGLRSKGWRFFYWLNIQEMAQRMLKPHQTLVGTKYFTSIVNHPSDKHERDSQRLRHLLWSLSCRRRNLQTTWAYSSNPSREDDRRQYRCGDDV